MDGCQIGYVTGCNPGYAGSIPVPSSKPLELDMPAYYLYGMRSQFVIDTNQSALTVVRDGKRVRYTLNDGDTILMLSTGDETMVENLSVSKYNNAQVRVQITIELDDTEYENVQP